MRVYNYDKTTKEYKGFENAVENPERKGSYLIPANSTTLQPGEYDTGFIPVFKGEQWVLIRDLRGNIQINAETEEQSVIKELGDLKENYQLYDDYIKSDLYKQRLFKRTKEDLLVKNLENAKFAEQNSLIEYKNCVFETSDSNRGNLRDTSEGIEKGLVTNVIWLDKNDTQVPVTLEDIITVRSMILLFVNNLWNITYLSKKQLIENALSIEELSSISIDYSEVQ